MGISRLESVAYWRNRPRSKGAGELLSGVMLELLGQVGADQMRALSYQVGMTLAKEHVLKGVRTLGQLQSAAQQFLSDRDWGWLHLEEHENSIDFVQGCSPLRAWFGTTGLKWSTALFEGLYSEWLRQLGAGAGLELRQVGNPKGDEDLLCFRLMHGSFFAIQ